MRRTSIDNFFKVFALKKKKRERAIAGVQCGIHRQVLKIRRIYEIGTG